MLEIADVLRLYGQSYLDTHGVAVPQRHRQAIQALVACRTAQLGGHLYQCDRCQHQRYAYHSCRNRHCPKCHGRDTEAWLACRRGELLPVPYFHLVFTLPSELRRIVRHHQHVLYGILMQSAAEALLKLASDPRHVGGRVAILAVLHTWTRTLEYHPHVHCLVPGGGQRPDGDWVSSRNDFLVPVRALSRLFRGIFMAKAKQTLPDQTWPPSLWKHDWVVYAKPTVQSPAAVLTYLARYVHRIAIANSRILAIDNNSVTFRYKKVGDSIHRTMTLDAHEFIRRFLQHVLPDGFHKVRYYGLWAPSNRPRLNRIRNDLTEKGPSEDDRATRPTIDTRVPIGANIHERNDPCPNCQCGHLRWVARIPPIQRGPPTS